MFSDKYLLRIVLAVLWFSNGCGLFENEESFTYKNPVYANVFFEKTHPNGAPVQGIIAINYDNPKEFKLLTSGSASYNNMRLSPDGEKLIYTDKYETGVGSNPQHGVYYTHTGNKELLYDEGQQDVPLFGHERIDITWNKDSNGFYYTNPAQPFSGTQAVWYYDLESRKTRIIKESQPSAIIPLSVINSDTLFVFSNEFDTLAYYQMNSIGEYISIIENPFLLEITLDGRWKRGLIDFEWNDSLKLFTASYFNQNEFNRFKIIVTDVWGRTFKEFTNGLHENRNPTWTNDGKIIFTEQRDLYTGQKDSELKLLDITTGEIDSFFSKREYPDITGIGTSDQ